MTIETTDNRITYPANGVKTNYPFQFKVYDANDIFVKEDNVPTTANVTVNLNDDQDNNPGGSVDIVPAIAAPIIISIERLLSIDQPYDYPVGGSFPSSIHERGLDRLVMMVQQQMDLLSRTIRANETEDISGINLEIPGNSQRQGMFLAFDGLGNVVAVEGTLPATVPISPYMQTLMPSIDDIAARAILKAPGNDSKNLFTDSNTLEAPTNYAISTGAENYIATLDPAISVYRTGTYYNIFIQTPNAGNAPTLDINGVGQGTIVNSDGNSMEPGQLNGAHLFYYDGAFFRVLNTVSPAANFVPQEYRAGLGTSPDVGDPDNDINILPGEATDTTNSVILTLDNEITKQIDAPWAVGDDAGGRFTPSLLADTWYHLFLIRNSTDGSIDAGWDTDINAVNIPAGWVSYQRIASHLTDGGPAILGYQQFKKTFIFDAPILDYNSTSITTRQNMTLSVPLGFNVLANFNFSSGTAGPVIYFAHPDTDDMDPSVTVSPLATIFADSPRPGVNINIMTDKSSQIAHRALATKTILVATTGWEELW